MVGLHCSKCSGSREVEGWMLSFSEICEQEQDEVRPALDGPPRIIPTLDTESSACPVLIYNHALQMSSTYLIPAQHQHVSIMTVSTLACRYNLSTIRGLTEPLVRLQTLHVIFCTPLSGFRSSSASLVSAGFSIATMDQLFCKEEAWGAAGLKWKPFSLSCSLGLTKKKEKKKKKKCSFYSLHFLFIWRHCGTCLKVIL